MTVSIGVDVGGTFTDVVGVTDAGLVIAKVSTDPADQSASVAAGLRAVGAPFAGGRLLHGTTAATNALLEQKGTRVALLTTAGFEDVIEIARQQRPALYDPFQDRPEPLVAREDRIGVAERLDPDGVVEIALTDAEAARAAALIPDEAGAVAVSLLYDFLDDTHERRLETALAAARPEVPVTLASRIAPEFREFERTSTAVLNAYLYPVTHAYLARLATRAAELGLPDAAVLRSSGGVMPVAHAAELPAALLLSGPAGGVAAAAAVAAAAGYLDVLTFDMGGTSTDVCLVRDGQAELAAEREASGYPCRLPALGIHTVGAGGGSLGWRDAGGALRAGPRSAGARPGPACYGRGGTEPTVTDAHVVLGHLPAALLGGAFHLDAAAAARAVGTLGGDVEELAAGLLAVVDAEMERALRVVSVARGEDPARFTLVAFGGAGPLHAAALADAVGSTRVLVPARAGVLSALGLLLAPGRHDLARSVRLLGTDETGLAAARAALVADLDAAASGSTGAATTVVWADCRYPGQSFDIPVPLPPDGTGICDAFHAAHAAHYGYSRRDEPVEVTAVRGSRTSTAALTAVPPVDTSGDARHAGSRAARIGGGAALEVPVHSRARLDAGFRAAGPLIIEEAETTTLVPAEWEVRVDMIGNLVLER